MRNLQISTVLTHPKFFRYTGNLLIIAGIIFFGIGLSPVIQAEVGYYLSHQSETPQKQITLQENQEPIPKPVNTSFSVIIPKINVNAPITENVAVVNQQAYLNALENGVAHAETTTLPSTKPGNTYLFAHSTPNPLDIKKYSAVFTLLNKLEKDDLIYIIYQNNAYIYSVDNNDVVGSFNLNPLTRTVDVPMLTLQTCDPPGVPINRRVVTAELEEVIDLNEEDQPTNHNEGSDDQTD